MNKAHNQSGYIMVLALMVIGISIILVTQLFNRASVHRSFVATMTKREQAKELALSGIAIAQSQLYVEPPKKVSGAKPEQQQKAEPYTKRLLQQILPNLNRWQTFNLQRNVEGIKGKIDLYISCEEGKLNINHMYDFAKKKFKGEGQLKADFKKMLMQLFGRLPEQGPELFKALTSLLASRGYPFNDVTQFLSNSTWAKLFAQDVFAKKETAKTKQQLYLTDLFTVFTAATTIDPWLFSHSVATLLGLPSAMSADYTQRKEKIMNALKNYKESAMWQTDWDKAVGLIYGKNFNSLPKAIHSMMSRRVEPTTFSVISRAQVGSVSQSIFAILAQRKQDAQTIYEIERVYWI